MQHYAWSSLVFLAMSFTACKDEPQQQKPEHDKLRMLQGKWRSIIEYRKVSSGPTPKVIEVRHGEDLQVEVEFLGNIGIIRQLVLDEGDIRSSPFAWLVNAKEDPITCDSVSYPIRRGEKPRVFFVGILKVENDTMYAAFNTNSVNEADRPKLFDPAKDEKCTGLVVLERVKR